MGDTPDKSAITQRFRIKSGKTRLLHYKPASEWRQAVRSRDRNPKHPNSEGPLETTVKIQQMDPRETMASLNTDSGGLASTEAQRRLKEYGPNRVEAVRGMALPLRLLAELTTPFSLVLWVAALLAFALERITLDQGMARLGYTVVVVILISGLFSFSQEYRSERALAALQRLLPQRVQVLRDGKGLELPAERLVPSDLILLAQGDNVPADCRLIEAVAVRVNNATLTGESFPQPRDAAPCTEESPAHSRYPLLAGTSVVAGRGKAVVFATGMQHTEFGGIAHRTQTGGEDESPLRREIAHLSRLIVLLAVIIGGLFFGVGWALGIPIWEDFIFAVGIIIAMVPEGLLPTLTLALVLAAQRVAKRKVLVRHLPAIEALGATTVICTDKTGTLTQNRMRVQALRPYVMSAQRNEVAPGFSA